ncbi:MAG: FHA domain-containing protein [Caldimonas sp.]
MSMKSWVLDHVHGIGGLAGRGDLPPRGRGPRGTGREGDVEPDLDPDALPQGAGAPADALRPGGDLGVYTPLIGAVRDELEHFVASHVRLHVTIADRDRFLLTSIGVRSPGGAEARALLQQFLHEFKPEQVKRYLAREVIGRLPNAGVIDLALFAGLSDLDAGVRDGDDGEYRELLEALRTTPARPRPYEVSVLGRWSESDAPGSPLARAARGGGPTPATPLAGRAAAFEVSDADGTRVAVLHGVVPGRRYVVGKDEGSDLCARGTYTSRRHAEVWLDGDGWRVADAGSTNGIRVVDARTGRTLAPGAADGAPIRMGEGLRVVLSARAEGPTSDYPSLALHVVPALAAAPPTPIAAAVASSTAVPLVETVVASAPKTPLTAVLPMRPPGPRFEVTVTDDAGERQLAIAAETLPVTIGRSRDRSLVIDRRHAGVSGHHVALDAIDDEGLAGIVDGDNGVVVDGVFHASGERFAWRSGQALVLGGALPDEPPCTLALARIQTSSPASGREPARG